VASLFWICCYLFCGFSSYDFVSSSRCCHCSIFKTGSPSILSPISLDAHYVCRRSSRYKPLSVQFSSPISLEPFEFVRFRSHREASFLLISLPLSTSSPQALLSVKVVLPSGNSAICQRVGEVLRHHRCACSCCFMCVMCLISQLGCIPTARECGAVENSNCRRIRCIVDIFALVRPKMTATGL
jgi:hypothetical protein